MAAVTYGSINEDILSRLGAMIIASSNVDGFLSEFVGFMLQAHPGRIYLVTQSIAASSQSTWARQLTEAHIEDEALREEILDLLAEADDARGERNLLAHGIWGDGPVPGTAIVQSVRVERPEMVQTTLVTVSDLDELCARFKDLSKQYGELSARLGFARF